jgi:metal-responsive CopG/Arc/MetJ family transcriptional regulator
MVIHARNTSSRSRQSLRLDADVWSAIDEARVKRPGCVSRNSWISEAIAEKLKREKVTKKVAAVLKGVPHV